MFKRAEKMLPISTVVRVKGSTVFFFTNWSNMAITNYIVFCFTASIIFYG